jgi:hypothetical protein
MSNLFNLTGSAVSDLFGDEARKLAVWFRGKPISGCDPLVWRLDDYSNVIKYSDHGNRNSEYGWEIDHIRATALGGSDDITNLRPLHHRVNSGLGGALGALLSR